MATSYAFALQELLQRLQQTLGGLDDQTQQVTTATQRGLFDARKEKDKAVQSTNELAADRGMVNSGINIAEGASVRSRYDELMSRLEGDQTNALSSIARRRLEAQTGYNQGKTEIERQKYEADQAAAQAERERQAAAQLELAKQNPSGAGISVGASYDTPDAYAAAAQQYMAAQQAREQEEYAAAAQRYMAALNPPPPARSAPRSSKPVQPKQPLRPIRGAY